VPFLAGVAGRRELPDADRWQLLWMLGEIAIGRQNDLEDPDLIEARAAVARAAPDLVAELPSAGDLRWALVGLAAAVPEASAVARPALEQLLAAETNPAFHAALTLADRLIAGPTPSAAEVKNVAAPAPTALDFASPLTDPPDPRWPSSVCRYLIEAGLGDL
jgi:hypothetical protein